MKRFSDEEPQVDLDENEGEVRDHKKRGVRGSVREILLTVVIALAVSIVIKTFLFRAFVIPSTSMQNTLLVNDRVFVNQLFPQPFKLERGNVIVFKDDEKWLPELPQARPCPPRRPPQSTGLAPPSLFLPRGQAQPYSFGSRSGTASKAPSGFATPPQRSNGHAMKSARPTTESIETMPLFLSV